MSTVYVAVYLSATSEDLTSSQQPTLEAKAFVNTVVNSDWPYDVGDDPSYFCARYHNSPLSWGICRRDLRGAIDPGDTIVFIAHRKLPDGCVDYRWVGFATVAEKISQADIWTDSRHAVFRQYLNLLIRPDSGGGFVHSEIHPGEPHSDWLWRLTRSKGHRWQARDFAAFEGANGKRDFLPGRDRAANGETIELSPNYVIFSMKDAETTLLAYPPVIAEHQPGWGPQTPEIWLDTPLAQGLRHMTLDVANRTLRLTTTDPARKRLQQRHRHIRLPSSATPSAAAWRSDAIALLQDEELMS